MSKIVVTGSSGFLAGYVVKELVDSGQFVIPVTRKDMINTVQVRDYRKTPDADLLIHLAEEPNRHKVNNIGNKYVKESAEVLQNLVRRFNGNVIYASSGSVYGDKVRTPFTVDSPTYASDIYSESKLINEDIVLQSGGMVLRLANIYGLGMSRDNVISDIIKQMNNCNQVIVNDTTAIRDFISVLDVAELFKITTNKRLNSIVNVGSGVPISIYQLIELMLIYTNQSDKKIVSSNSLNKISVNVLNIDETTKLFNWKPTRNLMEQLHSLLTIYK
jgi:UDP-glucose 4-epimerase